MDIRLLCSDDEIVEVDYEIVQTLPLILALIDDLGYEEIIPLA